MKKSVEIYKNEWMKEEGRRERKTSWNRKLRNKRFCQKSNKTEEIENE